MSIKRILLAAGVVALAACWSPVEPAQDSYQPSVTTQDQQSGQTGSRGRIKRFYNEEPWSN